MQWPKRLRAGSALAIAHGIGDVADIANPATVARASRRDATLKHSQAKASPGAPAPLASVAVEGWRALADRAIEPNGYYLPGWALAIDASARDRTNVSALGAWSDAARLIGLMPAISLWRAYKIPLPALVSADPYGTLCTPLLDREMPDQAAGRADEPGPRRRRACADPARRGARRRGHENLRARS